MPFSHPPAVINVPGSPKTHQQIQSQTFVFCQSSIGEMNFQCGFRFDFSYEEGGRELLFKSASMSFVFLTL